MSAVTCGNRAVPLSKGRIEVDIADIVSSSSSFDTRHLAAAAAAALGRGSVTANIEYALESTLSR
jgi:hypothetical protein